MKKILFILIVSVFLAGCSFITKKEKSLVEDTSWVASDNSEIAFDKTDFKWYQNENNHDDNYYYGKYTFYIGNEAINYITTELSDYGITREELDTIFSRSELYSKDNFVVFDLRYEGLKMNGETTTPTNSLIPWYGFIIENNSKLEVVNMNTATQYNFTRK